MAGHGMLIHLSRKGNTSELEALEPRILLSGDGLAAHHSLIQPLALLLTLRPQCPQVTIEIGEVQRRQTREQATWHQRLVARASRNDVRIG
ncbi:MAG: hypothetical protein DME26_05425 [Verrucomicrobia bacterium]|nr:MAG: hypothetical protein DME26_05425 [Verrucomicrobiota bacterium]